jgi:hypothetical protein
MAKGFICSLIAYCAKTLREKIEFSFVILLCMRVRFEFWVLSDFLLVTIFILNFFFCYFRQPQIDKTT